MSDILEQSADFSLIATSLNLPVSSGCEVYSFLGGSTAAQAVKNWSNLAAPLVATGSPSVGASGAAVDSANYFAMPSSVTTDTSETYIIVMNTPVNPPTVELYAYTSASANSYNTGVTIAAGASGVGGPTALIGINNAGTAQALQAQVGANNTATFAAELLPCVYALTIDMSAMSVTFQCLSPNNWAISGATPLTKTVAIPAGATRYATPTLGYIGRPTNQSASVLNQGTVHFFGKWNRVLTSSEIAAVAAHVKSVLAKRGVSAS